MNSKILDKAIQILLSITVFLLPLFFAPFLSETFDWTKRDLLIVFIFLTTLLWIIKIFLEKKITFKISQEQSAVFLVLIAFLAASLISPINKMYSLLSTLGFGSLFTIIAFYFLIKNLVDLNKSRFVLYSLTGSGVIVSLLALVFTFAKLSFPLNFFGVNIPAGLSPTGSLVSQAIFLLVLLPFLVQTVREQVRVRNVFKLIIFFIQSVIILLGFLVTFRSLLVSFNPILLPYQSGWVIAVETIKNVKNAFFGLGPGQFINAFTSSRPLSFNAGSLWSMRFSSSSNWFFQLLTEIGLLGLSTYLFLSFKIIGGFFKTIRSFKTPTLNLSIYLSLILVLITELLLPVNFFLLALFFLLLALVKDPSEQEKEIDLKPIGGLIFIFTAVPIVLLSLLSFFVGKVSLANYYYSNSFISAMKNQGAQTYAMQIKTIQTDRDNPLYRIAYSQTNLALANSLSTKEDLSDQDRTAITQLVQQAIREAKSAVAIDPTSSSAWENLAIIYKNLINFAQGADTWTISAYQTAIQFDPINPRLRLDLGGVYFSQQNYEQAANFFAQSIALKPEWANAHYNLANALREKGDLENAQNEYEKVLSLVKIDTEDYKKAQGELDAIKKRVSPTPTPTPTPKTGLKAPLNLQEAGPDGITP